MLKVGVLTGDPEAEDYMIKYSKRPWLNKNRRLDDSVVRYLKYKKVNVQNIPPDKISDEEFKKHDIIFYSFLDTLAARLISISLYKKLTSLLKKHKDKIWPPYEYGKMISDKCEYYEFLKNKKIPVAPFRCFETPNKVQTKKSKYGTVVKPVLGTSSIGMKIFKRGKESNATEYAKQLLKSYPKIVSQNLLPFLANGRSPEIKMYYIGNEFVYGWITYGPQNIYVPFDSKSKSAAYRLTQAEKDGVIDLCTRVIRTLSPIGKMLLVTRIDVYWNLDKKQWYVNEIEYAPAFIVGKMKHFHQFMVDQKIGKQMINIIKQFKTSKSIYKNL